MPLDHKKRLLDYLDTLEENEHKMNAEIQAYLNRVIARNSYTPPENECDIAFHFDEEIFIQYKTYFKRCYKWNLSPYKALFFFNDYHPEYFQDNNNN
jgi:hypothetical protein